MSTGGQAGWTWRLIAIAAVVGAGTWVAGDRRDTIAEPPATAAAATASAYASAFANASAAAETSATANASANATAVARPAPTTHRAGPDPISRPPVTGPGGPSGRTALHKSAKLRARAKTIYLTFDDGPDKKWTPRILAVLKRYDAKATFFQLGRARRANPKLARRVEAEGHAIANHSTTHRDLTMLSNRSIRWEVRGGPDSPCFRPPYGAINPRVRGVLRSEGVRHIVLWDIDTLDWTRPGANRIAQKVIKRARPGKIVLMHDGGANRSQTVEALDTILRELYAKGYVFRALNC